MPQYGHNLAMGGGGYGTIISIRGLGRAGGSRVIGVIAPCRIGPWAWISSFSGLQRRYSFSPFPRRVRVRVLLGIAPDGGFGSGIL